MCLQEASENLQYLREYVSVLQDVEPRREDLERLYISAHTLSGTSASYGFPRFSEIAAKLAHVFQYALNAPLGEDLHGPLTEFLPTVSRCSKRISWKSATRARRASRTSPSSKSGIASRSQPSHLRSIFPSPKRMNRKSSRNPPRR